MGLRKVAAIHAQMEQVFKQVGFKGSYKDFVHYLRTDPRFYYKDPKQLLEAYRAAAMRVDPLLVNEFPVWILPRVPYGVRPIPASLAPDTYPAYSDPPAGDGSVAGYVSVNLYKPESRPKYEIQVLVCHEGRPGRQLQIPIAMQPRTICRTSAASTTTAPTARVGRSTPRHSAMRWVSTTTLTPGSATWTSRCGGPRGW